MPNFFTQSEYTYEKGKRRSVGIVMVLQNERSEYLFAEELGDESGGTDTTYYTLTNRHGDILRAEEIPVKLETFIETQRKAGFREIDFC